MTVGIKTAGNYRSVAKNTELVAKPVAEDLVAHFVTRKVGPIEFVAVFKINTFERIQINQKMNFPP